MSQNDWLSLFLGAGGVIVGLTLVGAFLRQLSIEVEDEHAVVVTRFGKLVATLEQPGLHVWPSRILPWVKVRAVSKARDFRVLHAVHANDARGTTVLADVWVELRIVDPVRALFAVEDWDKATMNLVVHAALATLAGRDFQQILDDRTSLGEQLRRDVSAETERWGVHIEQVFIRHVALLPEVSRQVFGTVAARLEHARALIEEKGRLDVAHLEARTERQVAELVAKARAQYPVAVGRALDVLARRPEVLAAYNELYALAQVKGARTVAFRGFEDDVMRAVDAAMVPPSTEPARTDT
jgi:regulator of protease activity HflC (stomatin/prohibitin superfamily)